MNKSENISELAIALSKCQGELEPARKDSLNPHFKSKYADLNSVWDACRLPLSRNGLSVVQTMDTVNDKLVLNTLLLHSSGQWIKSTMPVVTAKNDAQGIGSGLSYARRYSLSAICGISQDDDDGEAATRGNKENKVTQIIPTIGQDKIKQLSDTADVCDPDYMSKLYSYLNSNGIKDFSMMREDMFPKIMRGMLANADSYQKQGIA